MGADSSKREEEEKNKNKKNDKMILQNGVGEPYTCSCVGRTRPTHHTWLYLFDVFLIFFFQFTF